ncbi:acetylglutamate kinase [Hibiscus syriacus]|uniref:Acetylglutamate kinase n=1 Tax=Hibiscus syriacus TaxID=106335 RepID=A0A6A3C520_HIBSY|nr:pre-mRNA-splicing factor cwc21-like [Hibiscus syriacus]KAE8724290.1 acetylglutamate kinase [Hibiscus syriacus]
MYNGIGLTTPRGSGTNGYIQSNKFFVKPKTNRVTDSTGRFDADQVTAGLTAKKPNKEILEHDRKRQIEVKILILEDKLTEQGYTESEIADKIAEARKALEDAQQEEEGEVIDTSTHDFCLGFRIRRLTELLRGRRSRWRPLGLLSE